MENVTDVINELIRPILTLIGFGTLTAVFLLGRVTDDVYVPLVALMIGFFFRDVTDTVQATIERRRHDAERSE